MKKGLTAYQKRGTGSVVPKLKFDERRVVEEAFAMGSGYVLDFSDRTFAEFFESEFGIDIDDDRYRFMGTSKANRLRAFIEVEDAAVVARVLRALRKHCEAILIRRGHPDDGLGPRMAEVIARLEGEGTARTDAIDRFTQDDTLVELVAAIERDINAGSPGAALDRLHTYSMKRFAHALRQRDIPVTGDEPLHSRVGKWVNAIEAERRLTDVTRQAIKSAIGLMEKFNHARNHLSLAHDNELVERAEARFIFETVSAVLRLAKALDGPSFET